MSAQDKILTGACLCGKVTYSLAGKSATPIYNTICHCLNCRRATGAPMLAASICHKEGFSITKGSDIMSTYVDTLTDSGKPLTRTFCSTCGSKLFAFPSLNDEIVGIVAGSLDDFDSWKPDKEQYCIHRSEFVEKMKGVEGKNRHTTSVQSEPEEDWDAGVGINEGGVGSVH